MLGNDVRRTFEALAARHDAYYAALASRPGSKGFTTDVCVPISRLAECIGETKQDLAQSPIPNALVGHVGDGNFHLVFMIDPHRPEEIAEANRLNERLIARALAMDGTCTGEHGVGYGKMRFLVAEHGDAVSVMGQCLQSHRTPNGILQPRQDRSDLTSLCSMPQNSLHCAIRERY